MRLHRPRCPRPLRRHGRTARLCGGITGPGAFDARSGTVRASPRRTAQPEKGPGRTNLMAVPSIDNLRRLAALLDDGPLRVHIHDTFEFRLRHRRASGLAIEHVRGKLAISVR